MGVRISKNLFETEQNLHDTDPDQENVHDHLEILTKKPSISQRNDNAIKLVQNNHLLSNDSSDYKLSSITNSPSPSSIIVSKIQNKSSPKFLNKHLNNGKNSKRLHANEQYWFEKFSCRETNIKSRTCTPVSNNNINKPPWKPSTITNSWIYSSFDEYDLNDTNLLGKALKYSYLNDRKLPKLFKYSLLDSVQNYDTAHLRRCSTARKIKRDKLEHLDSMSVDLVINKKSGNKLKTDSSTKINNNNNILLFEKQKPPYNNSNELFTIPKIECPNVCKTTNNEKSESLEDENSQTTNDLQKTTTPDWLSTIQDDQFPLNYVFYVDDNPNSLRAFVHGGVISMIARDTKCRVYFHARHKNNLTKYYINDNKPAECRIIEPALFYQGRKVRPVTVAAPNLTKLRRFLECVDVYYPEFEASEFLTDSLISS